MNYQEIYNKIVKNRLENPLDTYTERHHILPKSLGGNNKKTNLVKLSAREHYICHLLLTKIYNTGNEHKKMIYAFLMMCNAKSKTQKRNYEYNSRLYEKRRIEYSQIMSEKMSSDGKKYMWIYNPVLKISRRVPKTETLEEGWFKGRFSEPNSRKCLVCGKITGSPLAKFCCNECRNKVRVKNSFLYENKDKFKEYYLKTHSINVSLRMLGKKYGGNHNIVLELINEDPELKEIYNLNKKT